MSFERAEILLGGEGLEKLSHSCAAVIGVGGVGGYACEILARCGVGKIVMADFDTVEPSDLNRQITALASTLGRYKTEVMKDRILDINPLCEVRAFNVRLTAANCAEIIDGADIVIDAIDSLPDKIALAAECGAKGIAVVSSMGAGNRKDFCDFKVTDIYKTKNDPLARKFRSQARAAGIGKLDACFTETPPSRCGAGVGSIAYVPSVCGIRLAAYAVEKLLEDKER